jgi:hypothetical protein
MLESSQHIVSVSILTVELYKKKFPLMSTGLWEQSLKRGIRSGKSVFNDKEAVCTYRNTPSWQAKFDGPHMLHAIISSRLNTQVITRDLKMYFKSKTSVYYKEENGILPWAQEGGEAKSGICFPPHEFLEKIKIETSSRNS